MFASCSLTRCWGASCCEVLKTSWCYRVQLCGSSGRLCTGHEFLTSGGILCRSQVKRLFQCFSSATAITSARPTSWLRLLTAVLCLFMFLFYCCVFAFFSFLIVVFEIQQRSLSVLFAACLLSEYPVSNTCMVRFLFTGTIV